MPRKTHFGKSDYSTLSTPFYNKTGSFNHVMSQQSPEVFSKMIIRHICQN